MRGKSNRNACWSGGGRDVVVSPNCPSRSRNAAHNSQACSVEITRTSIVLPNPCLIVSLSLSREERPLHSANGTRANFPRGSPIMIFRFPCSHSLVSAKDRTVADNDAPLRIVPTMLWCSPLPVSAGIAGHRTSFWRWWWVRAHRHHRPAVLTLRCQIQYVTRAENNNREHHLEMMQMLRMSAEERACSAGKTRELLS